MHRTRNAAYGQPYRGFESLPLRHNFHFLRECGLSPGVAGIPPEFPGLCASPFTPTLTRDIVGPQSRLFGRGDLVSGFRWYGHLRLPTKLAVTSACCANERSPCTAGAWVQAGAGVGQTAAKPSCRRCSLQSSGRRVSLISLRAVSSSGCLPVSRPVMMSGAR